MDETTVVNQENTTTGIGVTDYYKMIGDAISDFTAVFLWLFNKIKEFFAKLGQ